MGAGGSIALEELSKPEDASDLKDEAACRAEVVRLRKLLRNNDSLGPWLSQGEYPDSAVPAADLQAFQASTHLTKQPTHSDQDQPFQIAVTPGVANVAVTLEDFLAHEFNKHAGKDTELSWDQFWLLIRSLELGLNDSDIAKLRQQADLDSNAKVSWDEMLAIVIPQLHPFWEMQMKDVEHFQEWAHLHWSRHRYLERTTSGQHHRADRSIWYNKARVPLSAPSSPN